MTKKILIGLVTAVLLGIGYYGISPLFNTIRSTEALPVDTSATQKVVTAEPVVSGSLVQGTVGHPASGYARIVSADGKNFLRYEDFKTINGPDIYVYLAKDLNAKEFVDLGKVRVTEGSVNYEIPNGVNPEEYPYALVWCKTFSVLFNSAKLR